MVKEARDRATAHAIGARVRLPLSIRHFSLSAPKLSDIRSV